MNAGHIAVDLGHHQAGLFHGALDHVNADAQAEVAVLVGKGGLNQGYVYRDQLGAEEVWHGGEEYGGIVGGSPVDRVSGALPHEEGVQPEVLLQLFVGIGGHPQGPDVDQFGIEECFGMVFNIVDQGSQQILGLAAAGADEYPVSGMNMREYLFLRGELFRIALPKLL